MWDLLVLSLLYLSHCLVFVRPFRLESLVDTVENYDNISNEFVFQVSVNKECLFDV